jgi:hypothetical protein
VWGDWAASGRVVSAQAVRRSRELARVWRRELWLAKRLGGKRKPWCSVADFGPMWNLSGGKGCGMR